MKNQRFKSNFEYPIIASLLVLLICLFFYPVVFGERTLIPIFPGVMPDGPYGYQGEKTLNVLDPTAFIWLEMPGTIFASNGIKSDQLPLWNPYAGGGTSLSANLMLSLYNPLKAFLLISSSPAMFNFYLLLRLFLAGFFTFIFLRKIGLSQKASIAGALCYMFSGHFMCYLTLWHLNTDLLIPFLLYLFELNVGCQKKRYVFFAGVGIALVILAGSPQAALLCILLAVLYYFSRTFTLPNTTFSLNFIGRQIVKLCIVLLVGVFLSGVMLADFYQFFMSGLHPVDSFREDLLSRINQYSPRSLISFLFSPLQLLGSSSYQGIHNTSRMVTCFIFPYLGIIPVLLSCMALGTNPKTNKLGMFFLVFILLLTCNFLGAGVQVSKMMGGLFESLTILFWAKYSGTLVFSVAVLAALGVENINKRCLLPLWNGFLILCIIFFVAVCYSLNPAFFMKHFDVTALSQANPMLLLFSSSAPLTLRAILITIVFLGTVVLVYRYKLKVFNGFLVVLLFGELYIYHQPVYALRHDPYAKAPYIDYLINKKKQEPPFRICGGAVPQISSIFGLENIGNIDGIYLERYYSFMMNLILKSDIHWGGVHSLVPVDLDEINSRFLDLLNVKYFVSKESLNPLPVHIENDEDHIFRKKFGLHDFFLMVPGGLDEKSHYPNRISYNVTVPEKGARVHFTIGVAPDQWLREGDGVEFRVSAESELRSSIIFQKYIDPKKQKEDRRVYTESVDLGSFRSEKVKLTFSVRAGPISDDRFDLCGFSDIELVPKDTTGQRLALIYDNEIKIYRNNLVMPRAFVVHRAEKIINKDDIFKRLRDNDFDFRKTIIVEADLPEEILNCNGAPLTDNSSVVIESYTPNRIVLEANMQNDGFLVLADTYYPRWRAYVDGRETKIYPADYMLRAIFLSRGSHEITFAYDFLPFKSLLFP